MKALFVLLAGAFAAVAQPFSAGVKVGVPFTDVLNAASAGGSIAASTSTDRFIVGVTGELHLPLGLSIEADVLYRRFSYQPLPTITSASSNAWQFPVLAKYKFPSKIIRPYIDGGVSWSTLQGVAATVSSDLKNNTTTGIVLGAGVEIKALVIRISPEIRYTHWTSQAFTANSLLQSNQNQADFLVGITF
jgi:hypothetical protein